MTNTPPLTGRSSRNLQYPGFPFPPRQAMNMGAISDVDYSAQLMGQDRSGNLGAYRQQLEPYDPLKDGRYPGAGRPASIPAGNGEGLLAHRRDDETPYLRLIDAIKKRDTITIQSLLNQGLDINYKMLDGNTPVDVAKASGIDLRYLQKYSPGALGRSYLPKSTEQQMPSYQPPPYQPQARAQRLQFPIDHQMSASLLPSPVLSDFVMMGAGLNQFSHLQDRYSVPTWMPTQYAPPVHPISKSYPDSQLYLSGLPTYDKRREIGTPSGRSKQFESLPIENYPSYNNSPRPNPYATHSQYHSTMTNSTSAQKADHMDSKKSQISSLDTKTQNHAEGAVIDLTDSNSPDVVVNSGPLAKEYKSRSEPPPLLHTSSMKGKEPYRPPKSYGDPRGPDINPANSYPPCLSASALHSMGGGYGLSTPPYAAGIAEPNPYVYDPLNRSHSAKGLSDSASQKIGSPWPPSRYFTPSPHHYISLEPRNKNESPSLGVKSKMLPQPGSDLAFNYPEGSKMEHLQAGRKFPVGNDGGSLDPFAMNKMRPWQYKDDSKLSPYENHLLDSARGIKTTYSSRMPTYSPYKKHEESASWQKSILDLKRPSSAHYSKAGSALPIQRKILPVQATVNGTAEVSRNSVIQSAPKYIENNECGGDRPLELTSPKKERDPGSPLSKDVKEPPPETSDETSEAQGAPESNPVVTETPSIKTEEGEQSRPVIQEQVTEEDSGKQLSNSPVNGTRKRKLSFTKEESTLKKVRPSEDDSKTRTCDAVTETENKPEPSKNAPDPPAEGVQAEKTVKRPRRSGDMDEYLYDWVMSSDDDTVNDDSSDEDYNCPTKITGVRGAKSAFSVKPRTTRRMSSIRKSVPQRTDEESWTSDSADKAEPLLKRRHRRTRDRPGVEKEKSSESGGKLKRSGRKKKAKKSRETQIAKNEADDAVLASADPPRSDQQDAPVFDARNTSVATVSTALHENSVKQSEEFKAPSEKIPVSAATPAVSSQTASADEKNAEPEPQVRKKRKYVRKLDKNGLPIKRMRRSKNVPDTQEVKKKRKYRKRMRKSESKLQDQDRVSVKSKIDTLEENLEESSLPATLAALITKSPKGLAAQSTPKDDTKKTLPGNPKEQKSPTSVKNVVARGKESKDASEKDTEAGAAGPVHYSPTRRRMKSKDGADDKKGKAPSASASELGLASQDPPVKIKKKPGRKPGWRKYPDGNANAKTSSGEVKKVKKSKKPKGDGLPRFGQRKRGRGRRKMIKSNALVPVSGDESQQHGPEKAESKSLVKQVIKAEAEKRAGRQCFRNKRLDNENFLHVDCLDLDADQRTKKEKKWKRKISKSDSSGVKSLGDVNNITEELQSQEYDYVFDYELSLYNNDEQPSTSQDTSRVGPEEAFSVPASPLSHCQSRPATPSGLASSSASYQSPLPQNFKKLWCNSAIGETQLHKAARHGYMDNLLYYLERGANVNQADNAGYSALHEACVHNHLEAAMLLIQYGADVNKNADGGTRPLHDAVEYDHLEMVRLMLACGADPMLSKFSGRAIPNMIHSKKMGNFIHAYLRELKDDMTCEDKESKWKIPCSDIFDKHVVHGFNILDYPPETEADEPMVEFELFDEPPITTYLLEPEHEEAERANFYLLDDFLGALEKTDSKKQANIRVQMMSAEKFRKQICESWLHRPFSEKIMNGRDGFVEIVSATRNLEQTMETETVCIKRYERGVSGKSKVEVIKTKTEEENYSVAQRTSRKLPTSTHPENIVNALLKLSEASPFTDRMASAHNSGSDVRLNAPACDNHRLKPNSAEPNRSRRKSLSMEADSKGKPVGVEHSHQSAPSPIQENGECSSSPVTTGTDPPVRLPFKKAVKL